jgi:hypothetical protein
LTDAAGQVAEAYAVLRWAMPTGEPGHTFVLVGMDGEMRFSSGKCGWIFVPDHGDRPRGAACLIFRAK